MVSRTLEDRTAQLQRADVELKSLRARVDEVIKQRDKYRAEAIDALSQIPGGAGRALNELGMSDVPDGAAEGGGGDAVEAVPDPPTASVAVVHRGPAG